VARLRAGHRPPLKLYVQFSRIQLSRRLDPLECQGTGSIAPGSPARIPRTAWIPATASSPRSANGEIDGTGFAAQSNASAG
jgi:hypothetical protein